MTHQGIEPAIGVVIEKETYWLRVIFDSLYLLYSVYYVYRVAIVGVKLSIASIVSIVSTQVAPRLHHAHKKEVQLGTLLIDHILAFCWKLNGLRYSHVFSLVQDKNSFQKDCTRKQERQFIISCSWFFCQTWKCLLMNGTKFGESYHQKKGQLDTLLTSAIYLYFIGSLTI